MDPRIDQGRKDKRGEPRRGLGEFPPDLIGYILKSPWILGESMGTKRAEANHEESREGPGGSLWRACGSQESPREHKEAT